MRLILVGEADVAHMAVPNSAAPSVHREEFGAVEIYRIGAQATVACDPLANCDWIETQKRSCRGLIDDFDPEKTRTVSRVKAKDRIPCHTNAVVRHYAQHHRAGRRARAINDNLLSATPKSRVARPVVADITAPVVGDAHDGGSCSRQ
jgi:hypothetical protein